MKNNLKILLVLLLCITFTACADSKNSYSESGHSINQNGSTETGFTEDRDDTDDIQDVSKRSITGNMDNIYEDTSVEPAPSSSSGITAQSSLAKNTKQNSDDKIAYHCNVLITCDTIFDNLDKFDQIKLEVLPEGGIVYQAEGVEFYKGESAFDVLLRVTRDKRIHMEFMETPIYKSAYIEGINNIYEFDAGPLSGWMYKVNGKFPNYGSSRHKLENGDVIEWIYTCDLGADIGGNWNAQNSDKD